MVGHLTTETAGLLDALELDPGSATDALRRWLEASWGMVERYPVLLTPVMAAAAPAGDDHERHRPVTARLTEVIRRGRRTGAFDTRLPEAWAVTAVIALGHAAGQEAAAGRMSPHDAGVAYRDSALRLLGAEAARQ